MLRSARFRHPGKPFPLKKAMPVLFVLFLSLFNSLVFADAEEPAPDLSPEDVVRAQLNALRDNGPDHDGIERTYQFASPANRRATGPLERFIALFRNPDYTPMLNHESADIDEVSVDGDRAVIPVTITQIDGSAFDYVFVLSEQTEEPYEDMWMTDAVLFEGSTAPIDPDPESRI